MNTIPYGFCNCGCGEKTNPAPQTHRARGLVKGEPMKFLPHHQCGWKYDGSEKRGAKSPAWKGGATIQKGYRLIFCPDHPRADANSRVPEHVLVAERVLGKFLPLGAVIHHTDKCNTSDNSPGNLVICQDQSYHNLLHARMEALEACGNADWRKCWICKDYDDVLNLVQSGTSRFHQHCRNAYCRNLRRRKSILSLTLQPTCF